MFHTAAALAWRNVQYEVGPFGGVGFGAKKTILQRLAGTFAPCTLNGLMGPSGAGKTTLLNCLSGQETSNLTGDSEIYVGGSTNGNSTPVVSYFIGQHVHETMLPSLTVRQTLEYAYAFKNGTNRKIAHLREEHIDTVMRQLMLPEELLERPFGRCSGGEQKRLAIAQELMAIEKPTFLFVDEPTTGLDSTAALQVMACLKALSQSTKYQVTVVVSIHVPNHDILQLFDKLYVLAKGGLAIYAGPPNQIQSHLAEMIGQNTSQEGQPIEELIKIACDGDSSAVLALSSDCQTTESQEIAFQQCKLARQPFGLPNTRQSFRFRDLYLQTSRLLTLTFLTEWRHFGKQLLNYILVMCIIITMFNGERIKPNGCAPKELTNGTGSSNGSCLAVLDTTSLLKMNVNYLYLSLQIFVYIILASACVMISPIVKVFSNEHRNRWYSLGSFYLSFTVVSLLQLAICVLIVSLLVYFVSGQYLNDGPSLNWTRMCHYLFCLLLFSAFTQSIGQLLGVVFLNSALGGLIISVVTYTLLLMVDDFFIKSGDILYRPFVIFTDIIGIKNLIRYLLYIFYGIDRCNPQTEYSFLLANYDADGGDVQYNFTRTLLTNTVVLRLVTFLLMYFKFSNPLDILWRFFSTKVPAVKSIFSHSAHINLGVQMDHLQEMQVDSTTKKEIIAKSTLPTFPESGKVMFAWRNLSLFGSSSIYELNNEKENRSKVILRSVAGQVTFGSLSALMGPSGAGKTSLLRVLNGQFKDRLSAGTSFYLSKLARIRSCFITQEVSDHLWPGLTAKQALIYASKLKNSNLSSAASDQIDHESIAMRLLDELGLSGTADTKLERCSGGERKRLALAQELTSLEMPNLICIDEPTSGLDSASADIVMACLKSLVTTHPIAIVTSIHQPNSSILHLFDQIYVLARGGQCIYSGPPKAIHEHLRQLPQTTADSAKYCHETLINHACLGHEDEVVQTLCHLNDRQYETASGQLLADVLLVPDGIQQSPTRFSLSSFFILWKRNLSYNLANQLISWLSFVVFLLIFVNVLLFFWKSNRLVDEFLKPFCINIGEDYTVQDATTCTVASRLQAEQFAILHLADTFHFFIHVFFVVLFNIQGAAQFFYEFPRLRVEHRNGWYSMGAFYLMKSLSEMAVSIPILMVYLYFGNLYTSIRPGMYWYMLGLVFLTQLAWQGLAHLLLVLANENILLQFMLQLSVALVAIFLANFVLALAHLHYVYQFISKFSIIRYLFEGIVILIYGLGRCDARHQIQPTLYWMGIEDSHLWTCILMLAGNFLFYRVVTLWCLNRQLNPVANRRQRVDRVQAFLVDLKSSNSISNSMNTVIC